MKKEKTIREFSSGATRNLDINKYDYEGFLSPFVLHRFGKYMHKHRFQADGNIRASDNWQKGMPKEQYVKSLVRHTFDFWVKWRGGSVIDPDTNKEVEIDDLACAIIFNIQGFLHEHIKDVKTKN